MADRRSERAKGSCRCGWRPTRRPYADRYATTATDWHFEWSRLTELVGRRPDLAETTTAGARLAAGWAENA